MKNKLFRLTKIKNNSGIIHNFFISKLFKFPLGFKNVSYINKYLQNIKPYKTSSHKIWEVSSEKRNDILKLDWNEATVPPSPLVKQRLVNLIQGADFINLYPKIYNNKILDLLSNYTNLPKENIQYFSSSDAIHEYIAKMYISHNDKVLIQGPSYDNFRLSAEANGAKIYYSETDENFNFLPNKFRQDIRKIKPSFVYICSPNNPCGFVNPANYIESLVKEFVGVMFLVDEAYFEFCKKSAQNLVLKYENILITRTMSKAFAMANLRFGYLLASKNNVDSISSIRNPKNMNTFTQEAAIAVLSDINYMESYVEKVNIAKEYFINAMKKYPQIHTYQSEANFVLMKFDNFGLKIKFKNYLESNNIFVRDLSQSPIVYKCLRITIGTIEQMKRVLEVIDSFFNSQPVQSSQNDKIAFFDFCETLVNFQTGNAYIYYVLNKKSSLKYNLRCVYRKYADKFLYKFKKNYSDKENILGLLKGLTYDELNKYAFNFYVEVLRPNFIKEILNELIKLKNDNYRIYIVSGGYDIYLKYFVEEFNLDGFFSTKIEFKNNICTGKFNGLDCMGTNKVKILEEYFKNEPIKKYKTIAYSDSPSDIPLLDFVENGVAVIAHRNKSWADKYRILNITKK